MSGEVRFKFNPAQAILAVLSVVLIVFGVQSISKNMAISGQTGPNPDTGIYDKYYYYEADRKQRYESYGARKPEMDPSEVVWRVNSDFDYQFYTKVTTISDFTPPVLVNKYRKLPDDFEPKGLVNTSSGQMMTPETKAAYESMRDAASEQGYHINAASAYRSIEYQKGYYNKMVMETGKEKTDQLIPRAAFSEQHLGTAVELSANGAVFDSDDESPAAAWVAINAHLYGFIVRYTDENKDITGYEPMPGMVTFVGTEIAWNMRRLGIKSLEEYYVKYVAHLP